MNKSFFIWALLAVLICISAYGQQTAPLKYSFREGTYFYFADQSISSSSPLEGAVAVRLSRDNGRGYRQVALITRAESSAAFRKIAGEKTWEQLKAIKNLQSDEQLWQYILQHPKLDEYGVLTFDIAFRIAMGSAFLDREAAGLSARKKWNYRIEYMDAAGKTIRTMNGSIEGGQHPFMLANIRGKGLYATDSSVSIVWSAPVNAKPDGLVLADVFRQYGGKGSFDQLQKPILANIKNDSVFFYVDDNDIIPQRLYRYYIRPKDQMGNVGSPSDTVSALSVNFASLPLLQQLTAYDTMNSIILKWKSLGETPQLVGVEIQRSRDARGNYVILDTISVATTSYVDHKVLPGIPYFYRLRVLGLKGMERETGYSGYATASVRNQLKHPDPPYGLEASIQNGYIKLQWQAVSDPDLYAYFVYRSSSVQGKFEVISPGIVATQFTDSSRAGGRTQYVYAVKAVSNNSLESEFSNKVSLRQAVPQLPPPPGGVSGHTENRTVVLSWPSMARIDHNIAGYNVYRRLAEKSPVNFDIKQSAAAQANKLGFELLNSTVIKLPAFEDKTAKTSLRYEYAVSSVDVFGIESTFSPFVPIGTSQPVRVIENWAVRKVTGGVILEWDPGLSTDADALIINRKKAGEKAYQRIGTIKNENSFLDKTAEKGALYIYRVHAERSGVMISQTDEKNLKL